MVQERAELSPSQRKDYEGFKDLVKHKCGIDLSQYKEQQMHRRLLAMVDRAEVHSFTDYFHVLDRDPLEWAQFLDRMTINVSELFRNPEKWEELKTQVLAPVLQTGKAVRVWSAGCSYGAEPYSLAMLLDDLAPGRRHRLIAPDIDQKILAKAQEGVFTDADVRNVPDAYKRKYLVQEGGNWVVQPWLRQQVTFRRHNLLADPYESGLDLIVCRNVVIYFTEDAKDQLYARMREALSPGGMIFVGGTERIFNARELGLECSISFFYRRID